MKILKKMLSAFLAAVIMASMLCAGTVSASAADYLNVVSASTPGSEGYEYIGQDLYRAFSSGNIYRITDEALLNFKSSGELTKKKVSLPDEMGGNGWKVYVDQNFKYSNIAQFYKGEQVLFGRYDKTNNKIVKVYSTKNYATVSKNGVITEFEYEQSTSKLKVRLISPKGKMIKTILYNAEWAWWYGFSHGSQHSYVLYADSHYQKRVDGKDITLYKTKLVKIDEEGKETILFETEVESFSLDSVLNNCLTFTLTTGSNETSYYYLSDEDRIEVAEYVYENKKGFSENYIIGEQVYGNVAIALSTDSTEKKKYYALMNLDKDLIVSDVCKSISTEDGEIFLTVTEDNDYTFINKKGKELGTYDKATDFYKGYALVTKSGKSYFIDKNMNRVSKKFEGEACAECGGGGLFSYEKNDKHYVAALKDVSGSRKKISSLKISVSSKKTYTGENRKATVTIKDGSYTLVKGTDYSLSYKNCKNIGTASVTITGKGKYTGTKTVNYKIVPKKTTLIANKKSDSVLLNWTSITGAEKYQIYYSVNGKDYKKLVTLSKDKESYTVYGLNFQKYDYYFIIRSYKVVDGKKYYSSYSDAVTVK